MDGFCVDEVSSVSMISSTDIDSMDLIPASRVMNKRDSIDVDMLCAKGTKRMYRCTPEDLSLYMDNKQIKTVKGFFKRPKDEILVFKGLPHLAFLLRSHIDERRVIKNWRKLVE